MRWVCAVHCGLNKSLACDVAIQPEGRAVTHEPVLSREVWFVKVPLPVCVCACVCVCVCVCYTGREGGVNTEINRKNKTRLKNNIAEQGGNIRKKRVVCVCVCVHLCVIFRPTTHK